MLRMFGASAMRGRGKSMVYPPLFLLMLLILCLPASSTDDYPNTGGVNEDFALGIGFWNNQIGSSDYFQFTKTLTNPKFSPLVDDLDGDGENEIVVFANNQIRVFRGNTLAVVDSIALPTADVYSPPIIHDLSVAQNEGATLTATKDTTLYQNNTYENGGSSLGVNSSGTIGGNMNALFQFDLSSIPDDAQIIDATLSLYMTEGEGTASQYSVQAVGEQWDEYQSSWNNRTATTSWGISGGSLGFMNGDLNIINYDYEQISQSVGYYNWSIAPLVQDWIDGDIENNGLAIVQNSTLTRIKKFVSRESVTASLRPKLTITYIGQEGRKEILVGGLRGSLTSVNVSIIGYNGTSLSIRNINLLSNATSTTPSEMLLSCETIESCLAVWSEDSATISRTFAVLFNSTERMGSQITMRTGTNTERGCFPLIPLIPNSDIDNDGSNEYVYSQVYTSANTADTSDDVIRVFVVGKNGNQVTKETEFSAGTYNLIDANKPSCSTATDSPTGNYPVGKYISSPLVYNFDGASGNGKEIVIAHALSPSTYQMASFQYDGTAIDTYPEIQTADGRILSNPMRMNAFPDTGEEDFCTLGFKQDDNVLDLICASMLTGNTPQTEEFMLSNSGLVNFSSSYQNYNAMTHAVKDTTELTEGSNLDEILMVYGTYSLVWDSDITPLNFLDGDNALLTQWVNPLQGGTLIQVDAESVGRDDIIALTTTNLWYFDDGFVNQPAQISFYQINPCVDRVWQINTSVDIQIMATDPEDDNVQYKAIIYEGTDNEQDSGYTSYFPSGTTGSFSFIANQTIGTGNIQLIAHDTENPTNEDIINVPFSVSSTGAELNDCTTISNPLDEDANETDGNLGVEPLDPDDNVVINAVRLLGSFTKLGILGTYLLIIIALNVWIMFEKSDVFGVKGNMKYLLVMMGITDFVLIILGAFLTIIPFGIIVLFVLLALLLLAFMFKDQLGTGKHF